MIIDIDFDRALVQARRRAEEMVRRGLYNRFGTDFATRVEHAKIGCMGEIAFEELLRQKGITYHTDRDGFEGRNADEFDFEIQGYKIDVKVAKTDKTPRDAWTYGYPQQQVGMEKDFVVVGWVSEQYRSIGMYGWILFNKILGFPLKEYNTFAGYKYQTPNYEFPWGSLNKDLDSLFRFLRANPRRQ